MNDTENTKIKDVLVKAKQLIKQKGWTQGVNHDENGYCMLGAICRVASKESDRIYFGALSKMTSVCDDSVSRYNDNPNRTKEEVLATLDKAIANCSQETG